ncbi:hypothetical protein KIPB_010730, partial [Kipferlia bialata]
VMYPMRVPGSVSESDVLSITQALEDVDLGYLPDRYALDAIPPAPWSEMLSVGEKQRLVDTEEKVMRAAFSRGICCVSVAHRPSCIRLHQRVLSVANGTASPVAIEQYNTDNPRPVIPPHETVASHTYPVETDKTETETVDGEGERKPPKALGLSFLLRYMTGGLFSRYTLYFGICVLIYCIAPSINVVVITLAAQMGMDSQCPVDPVTGVADLTYNVSVPTIWRLLLLVLASILVLAPATAISTLLSFRIGISWRDRVTRVVQGLYFKDSNYYRL